MTSSPQIAIIDDDAAVRNALVRLLTSARYRSTAFGSVEEFLNTLDGDKPDCLLVDYQMPKMTGLDLKSHLNAIGIRIPIIVITAHDEATIRENCIRAGVSAFLAKPIPRETLLASIAFAIKGTPAHAR